MKITVLFVCLAVGGTIGARIKRATGGKEIKIKDAPYFVSLIRNGRHVCGGAFISTQHVLTAAHCVLDDALRPLYNTTVVSGTNEPDLPYSEKKILKISAHEGFRERGRACDIAVITLSVPVVRNENRQEIALPNAEPRYRIVATFVGFQFRSTKKSQCGLRELRVEINPIDPTWNNSDDYGPVIRGTLSRGHFIRDTNLGGALVYEETIVGIASERSSTGSCGYFVNVLKFKTFIEKSMGMDPSPTEILWRPSVIDFDDIEWT